MEQAKTPRPLIPPHMEVAFAATIIRGVKQMLRDPEFMAEFEAWRKEYHRMRGDECVAAAPAPPSEQ